MSTFDESSALSGVLQTLRIIVGTLVAGPVFFLVVVLFLRSQAPANPPPAAGLTPAPQVAGLPLLTVMAGVFALTLLPLSVVLPRMVAASAVRQVAKQSWSPPPSYSLRLPHASEWSDRLKLAFVYQTQLILGAAMNEGAAFFAVIAYFLEGSPIALGLALVLIAGVAARFPTRERFDGWFDAQLGRVQELRAGIE